MSDQPVLGRGPAMFSLMYRPDAELNASFRAVIAYNAPLDTNTVRLDVMFGGEQMNIGFHARRARDNNGELPMPGRLDGFAVQANCQDLIQALRSLADGLEQQEKVSAERDKP